MPPKANLTVYVKETQGQEPLVSGGVSVEATADQTVSRDFVLPANLHVQGAHITWLNCQPGDTAHVDVLTDGDVVIGGYNLQDAAPAEGVGYWQLVGSDSVTIWNQLSVTSQLPAGFKLRTYLTTTADAGTRALAVNFHFRVPLA